ncbi:MAG: PHP domain-containing protein [Victivallaceae bacterium]|nr:PHP domain-containing protein [Victivallaceae bacterium]
MNITSDWHIHSHNSCDDASMLMSTLIREAEEQGIIEFGITDHIHTPYNLPDLEQSRQEFDSNETTAHFHFGVEVSCVSQWEIDKMAKGNYETPTYGLRSGGKAGCELAIGITAEDVEKYRVEYVVGGTHWPIYVPFEPQAIIKDYHRQNMFLATHPLVDIVAHPWWWMGYWQDDNGKYLTDPWFEDFTVIPLSMHKEFAMAVIEHNTLVEINLGAMLLNKQYSTEFKQHYLEYLAMLKVLGVKLSMGSDSHDKHYTAVDFASAATMLEQVGITENDLYSPVTI